MKKLLPIPHFFIFSILFFLTACQKETNIDKSKSNDVLSVSERISMPESIAAKGANDDRYNTFYGPQVQMGDGHVRTWVNITHDGKALAIGVEMTHKALQNLPQDPHDFAANTFILKFHQKAMELTPFNHFMLNSEPQGHEPAEIYDVPHFDFHFYKISNEERMAIPPYEVAPVLFDNVVPANHLPPTYFRIPGGVPQMGAHWANGLSPELQPPPNNSAFTHTFIYGTYDSKVIFLEPMITLETLLSGVTVHEAIAQPSAFDPVNKYYPTRYSIWKNTTNNRHYISLDEMIKK
jgi:hypothetical protein